MSRPYCLICKVSTKRTDTIYNIEVNHTKCTDTLLRDFLNTILNYAIKYSTLNVCSSCYGMVNELDILQNKADEAKKKLLSYFSTDLEFVSEADICLVVLITLILRSKRIEAKRKKTAMQVLKMSLMMILKSYLTLMMTQKQIRASNWMAMLKMMDWVDH